MEKKYQRKDFLKLSLLANLGLWLKPLSANPFTALIPVSSSSENLVYYKKHDPEYETLRKGFNKRIDRYPAIIALCKNTQGVAEAVQYAKKNNLPVAIKSGGHSMEGFSCNNDGMVINLSLMDKPEWIDHETFKTGPACTLSEIYDFVLPKQKIIPGGSCGSVGIGGLVLGGGYGILSRTFGLACDSLTEVTMVDGNGVVRNSKDDKELLWACKGGGNGNFGVITEMTFKAKTCPPTMQSWRFRSFKTDSKKAKAILARWFQVTKTLPHSCFSTYILNEDTVYILLTNTGKHSRKVKDAVSLFSSLTEKTETKDREPIAQALKAFYGVQHPVYFKNASAGLYKSYDEIETYIEEVLGIIAGSRGIIYQVNTLGGKIQNRHFEKHASFPHRDCTYFSELQTYWDNDAKQGPSLIRKFAQVQQIFARNKIGTQYCNYPDINFENWQGQYYGDSYPRLQQLKNKYDPANVIRHDQSIQNA